jgi:hypothetical protein
VVELNWRALGLRALFRRRRARQACLSDMQSVRAQRKLATKFINNARAAQFWAR